MKRQLQVEKSDGSHEAYLHTKVIGAINSALTAVRQSDMIFAEDLAEVVTFYLYKKWRQRFVPTHAIHSMIKAVLAATGHEDAALALSQHSLQRRLMRARTEVVALDMHEFADVRNFCELQPSPARHRWDKAQIVRDLTQRFGVPHAIARTIASAVEEKILRMEMTTIPLSLIKQLVLGETATMLQAERALRTTDDMQADAAT